MSFIGEPCSCILAGQERLTSDDKDKISLDYLTSACMYYISIKDFKARLPSMTMIEIDDDVFNYLKNMAEPLVDTPNSVLRRILRIEQGSGSTKKFPGVSTSDESMHRVELSSEYFIQSYLAYRYQERFRPRAPFRTMFESEKHVIYFQNFNKAEATNLWYRLSETSLKALRETTKIVLICFTNPAEDLALEIPLRDIESRIEEKKWDKSYLEVNIDPVNLRWRELDWNLEKYQIAGKTDSSKAEVP